MSLERLYRSSAGLAVAAGAPASDDATRVPATAREVSRLMPLPGAKRLVTCATMLYLPFDDGKPWIVLPEKQEHTTDFNNISHSCLFCHNNRRRITVN